MTQHAYIIKLHRNGGRRSGAVLIAVLVCMLVALLIMGALARLAIIQSRQSQWQQNLEQARSLVDASRIRAIIRLQLDANFSGETWRIDAADLDGENAGESIIRIDPSNAGDAFRSVSVEAHFPLSGPKTVQLARTFRIPISPPTETKQ